MTIAFGFTAEFGNDLEAARDCERRAVEWDAHFEPRIYQDRGAWWCDIFHGDLISEEEGTEEQFIQLRDSLYALLRTCHGYRFAWVGVEVFTFRSFDRLTSERVDHPGSVLSNSGLVLSQDVWNLVKRPDGFVPFSAEHVWRPAKEEPRWG